MNDSNQRMPKVLITRPESKQERDLSSVANMTLSPGKMVPGRGESNTDMSLNEKSLLKVHGVSGKHGAVIYDSDHDGGDSESDVSKADNLSHCSEGIFMMLSNVKDQTMS